jgi:hypothetical protein
MHLNQPTRIEVEPNGKRGSAETRHKRTKRTREDRNFPYAISSRFDFEPIILQKSPLSALVMRRPGDSLKKILYWVRGSPDNLSLVGWLTVAVCFHLSPILNCAPDISSYLRFRQGRSCSKRGERRGARHTEAG